MLHIRWMLRRDMDEILRIEAESFEFPWPEEAFIKCLRQRNAVGMTADLDDVVVGYMIYELHKTRLHVLNFAVSPRHRRTGVGRRMHQKLVGKLTPQRRYRILLETRESNLDAQLFFRAMGYRCVSMLRGYYDDCDDDAYVFQYRVPDLTQAVSPADSIDLP